MKKFLIIFALTLLTPAFALAQETVTTPDTCIHYTCACTWPPFNEATGSPLLTAMYQKDISQSGFNTAEECQDACIVESGLPPDKEKWAKGDFQCILATPAAVTTSDEPLYPRLNLPLPGLDYKIVDDGSLFGKVVWGNSETETVNGIQRSSILGDYVKALYAYLLGAATIIAVTMLMIAGIQYATARGESKQVENAKKRIGNAIAGIILLLLAYNIAFLINPATTTFESLSLQSVSEIQLDKHVTGDEGKALIYSATGTWENLSQPYLGVVETAKRSQACTLPGGFASPTGNLPNQGKHHWISGGVDLNYAKVKNLDWRAPWGSPIYAPFSGTVSYAQQTNADNKCGNRIYLRAPTGESITICHTKDFLDENGVYAPGSVIQGQVIGHVGGQCCQGSSVPNGWITSCNVAGTACSDPISSASCSCQPIAQSGNTSGPHVHVTMSAGTNNILSCLK